MTDVQINDPYFGKRDEFFYFEITDKSTQRDNKISELFDEQVIKFYHSPSGRTDKIYLAKFWKDKDSALRFINFRKKDNLLLKVINREEFIKSIPDKDNCGDAVDARYLKNFEIKKQEHKYQLQWNEHRKKYKAISAYVKVKDPQWWIPCKNCQLIPLVWEFNNGRLTACGCGENEYNHHSIQAESIMSYVTRHGGSAEGYNSGELRMNWNQWVKTGQNVFEDMKKINPDIW